MNNRVPPLAVTGALVSVAMLTIAIPLATSLPLGSSVAALVGSAFLIISLKKWPVGFAGVARFLEGWSPGRVALLSGALGILWLIAMAPEPRSDFQSYFSAITSFDFFEAGSWPPPGKAPALVAVYGALGSLMSSEHALLFSGFSIGLGTTSLVFFLKSLECMKVSRPIVGASGLVLALNPNWISFQTVIASEWPAIFVFSLATFSVAYAYAKRRALVLASVVAAMALTVTWFSRPTWTLALLAVAVMTALIAPRLKALIAVTLTSIIPVAVGFAYFVSTGRATANPWGGLVLLFGTSRETAGGYNRAEWLAIQEKHPTLGREELNDIAREMALSRIYPLGDFTTFFFQEKLPRLFSSYSQWATPATELTFLQRGLLEIATGMWPLYLSVVLVLVCLATISMTKKIMKRSLQSDALRRQAVFGQLLLLASFLLAAPHFLFEVQGRYSIMLPLLWTLSTALLAGNREKQTRQGESSK